MENSGVGQESMYQIIEKKRDKQPLTYEELQFWLEGYVAGAIPDDQSAALLMAIFLNGLSEQETNDLTDVMLHSGSVLDLSDIPGVKVDKHSSGGVGDKTSLVVAPLAAASGLKVAKMSGRGLGHTGGTLDKLESITGFQVELSQEAFIQQVRDCGIAMISQSGELVPADKKLYALRDVTATVNSIPLIASSIMSKKIATGADVIVLDVKYGKGAFMPTPEEAMQLAQAMIKIGAHYGRTVAALITSMESPLGYAVGNALEVDEAIATLRGEGPDDLRLLSIALGGELIYQSGQKPTRAEAYAQAEKLLKNRKAYKQFLTLVEAQHGSVEQVKKERITNAPYVIKMGALADGYVTEINAMEIGNAARDLGAGRLQKGDRIDYHAGIVLHKKIGDFVEKGECLAAIYASDIVKATEVGSRLLQIFQLGEVQVSKEPLIFGVMDEEGFIPWNALT